MSRRRTVTGDVPLGDGRTLRVALDLRDGEPDALHLAMGTGEGRDWREDPAEGLTLPATALVALGEALTRLAADA